MNARTTLAGVAALLSVAGLSGAVLADTTDATCEVRKDGETKQGASGPCTFTQRQGYVSIDLRNGQRIELSPGDRPDHYRDEKGHKVVLTASRNSNEYKWDNKKLIVRWSTASHGSSGSGHGHGHVDGQWDPIPCRFAGERKTCRIYTAFSQAGTSIEVKFPDQFVRKFVYDGGRFRSNDGLHWSSRRQGGTYFVSNDNKEEFDIPADWLK